jgi:hypothetical protein
MSNEPRRQAPPVVEEVPVLDQVMTVVNTEFGPIAVAEGLVKIWNRYGWPEDSVLKQMADVQPPERPVSSEETTT